MDSYCTWTVAYRVGGTLNFRWRRGPNLLRREDAEILAEQVRRQGYPCNVYRADRLDAIGLPETFSPEA